MLKQLIIAAVALATPAWANCIDGVGVPPSGCITSDGNGNLVHTNDKPDVRCPIDYYDVGGRCAPIGGMCSAGASIDCHGLMPACVEGNFVCTSWPDFAHKEPPCPPAETCVPKDATGKCPSETDATIVFDKSYLKIACVVPKSPSLDDAMKACESDHERTWAARGCMMHADDSCINTHSTSEMASLCAEVQRRHDAEQSAKDLDIIKKALGHD